MSEQLIAIAALTAAVISATGVLGQVAIQSRQRRLQEVEAHRQQAEAWDSLAIDWRTCTLVASGRSAIWDHGIAAADVEGYLAVIEEYRKANIAWLPVLTSDTFDPNEYDRASRNERQALEALAPYRHAVQRIMTHLAQVASLVVRKHVGQRDLPVRSGCMAGAARGWT